MLIAFAIIGIVEVAPNVCQIDYMRYVDVESVKLPCDVVKLNTIDMKSENASSNNQPKLYQK
jgi:hypothetical protein